MVSALLEAVKEVLPLAAEVVAEAALIKLPQIQDITAPLVFLVLVLAQ